MDKPKIVAFCGPAGSGKDVAAAALVELGWKKLSFADPIRDMLVALGVTRDQLANEKLKPIDWMGGKTPRQLMQTLGTEWGRNMIDSDLWIGIIMRRAALEMGRGVSVVISDCRFDNEAQRIIGLGGRVVRIKRDGFNPSSHPSEIGVSPGLLYATIFNDGTPSLLGLRVRSYVL